MEIKETNKKLVTAIKNCDFAAVKKAISEGADPNHLSKKGYNPLHWAVKMGRLDICKLLVEAGSDVDAQEDHGYTPLHISILCRRLDVVKYLEKEGGDGGAGASLEVRDNLNRTALDLAREIHDYSIIKYLDN